jgi:hypothetical protein
MTVGPYSLFQAGFPISLFPVEEYQVWNIEAIKKSYRGRLFLHFQGYPGRF